MAFLFNGTNQYLSVNSSPVGNTPNQLTMACWAKGASQARRMLMSLRLTSGVNPFFCLETSNANLAVSMRTDTSGAFVYASSTTAFDSTWHHVAATRDGANLTIYVDGVSVLTNGTLPVSTATLDQFEIGTLIYPSLTFYFAGDIAESALYSAPLSAAEVVSLAKGHTPEQVRPQSLVFYAPLVRNVVDTKGGVAITNNNTATVSTHPRIYA